MQYADLLPIGISFLVGAVQLFIFYRCYQAMLKELEVTAEYLKKITLMSMDNISKTGIKVGRLIDELNNLARK